MLGYACINMELRERGVFTNRTLRKATLEEKGYEYLSELIIENLQDMKKILEHNESEGIRFYRISSEVFPFLSHPELGYSIHKLPHAETILSILKDIGEYAITKGHRLTTHPGQFNVLASPNQNTVMKTVLDLEAHSTLFDLMGFEPSHYNKINIHVGGAYGEPEKALERFCDNFTNLLSDNCKKRLTVENDDKASMYSVKALYEGVYQRTGIPIVFDYHHHIFCDGGMTEREALELAISTWDENITPVVHYSESREIHRGGDKPTPAHSDLVYGPIHTYGHEIDIMIEAKHKEQAIKTLKVKEFRDTPEPPKTPAIR
jgi:UV DNA damage endonuclease